MKKIFAFMAWSTLLACNHHKPPASPPAAPAAQACSASLASDSPKILEPLPCDARAPSEAIATLGNDRLSLYPERFEALPGWTLDQQGQAIPAFAASCAALSKLADEERVGSGPFGGRALDWRAACDAVTEIPVDDHDRARAFFEEHFSPYRAQGQAGPEGKITGYYMQPLRASRKRGGKYQFPLYKRPRDLISIQLSQFVSDGRSRRVWGRLDPKGERLVPYATRTEYWKEQASGDSSNVLLWVDSPADAIAVEIEGSGRAILEDGRSLMVAFAGKNGRPSGRLGSIARAMRALEAAHVEGPWTAAELARYTQIAAQKTSIVFFEIESRDGAIGTQDVILTPRRSLAVDRALVPLSTPVWVDTRAPKRAKARPGPWRQLLIAQDTGGAIVGSIRGDIYWGDDEEALQIGRRVNGPGRMWLLLPKSIQVPSP